MTTGKTGGDHDANAPKQKRKGTNKSLWNCGQVRGPVQFTFARSIDPIVELDHGITRVALTNPGDTARASSVDEEGNELAGSGQMGRKSIVPYGLYCAKIFFNPHFAKDTGFSNEDLELFVQALKGMFDLDRSATRGEMSACKLIAFVHSSPLGNAPAARLFERVTAERIDDSKPPRRFGDYKITSNGEGLPDGVSIHHLL